MSLVSEKLDSIENLAQSNPDSSSAESPKFEGQSYDLPDKPVVTIEAHKSWVPLNLRDLWSYRELLYFLMWRDIKVRYKQTVLGAAWAVIQPLVTMLIFTYFFGKLAKVPTDGVPYPIFVYTAVLLWTFFSNGVTNGANSLLATAT